MSQFEAGKVYDVTCSRCGRGVTIQVTDETNGLKAKVATCSECAHRESVHVLSEHKHAAVIDGAVHNITCNRCKTRLATFTVKKDKHNVDDVFIGQCDVCVELAAKERVVAVQKAADEKYAELKKEHDALKKATEKKKAPAVKAVDEDDE